MTSTSCDCPECGAEDSLEFDRGIWVCKCCDYEEEAETYQGDLA